MKSVKMDLAMLKNKFRGSMLGVLVGDCIGSTFEFEEVTGGFKLVVQQCFDKLEGQNFRAPVKKYSDDAAMTHSLATALIENKKLDEMNLAIKFVKSFYNEPDRGYGAGVVTVFKKLRGSRFNDVFKPARDQFDGMGSWGNGAAMRVAPVSLFCYNDYNSLLDLAKKQSLITHSHKLGVDGAILQAVAVHQALHLTPDTPLNPAEFVDDLIEKMKFIEVDEEGLDLVVAEPYTQQLKVMKDLLAMKEHPNDEKVINELGNGYDVSAIHSVPTSIFCFLQATKPISGVDTDNPLRRAIQYAITLGGDADTIASMTGAIAGAYYGEQMFSENLLSHCEKMEEFRKLADELAEFVHSNSSV